MVETRNLTKQEIVLNILCLLVNSGVWLWVTLLPKLFLNTQRRDADADLGNRDYISYALWTIGVLF